MAEESCLDYTQILPKVYDPDTCSLRTTAEATIITPPALEVAISHIDDSIKIGDGTEFLSVNPDGSINVRTQDYPHTNQLFDEGTGTVSTVNFTEIYTFTSTDNNTRIISLECTCSTPSIFRLKIDGDIKRVLRSSSLERNIKFRFEENRPLSLGSTISVEAQVERLILASYSTFVSLEGYIQST